MRISRRRRRPQPPKINFKINEEIKTPTLRVVNDAGEFLGIMDTRDALAMAREKELDLIEIVPKGDPHVAKLTDYGRFKYQKEKEIKKQKSQQKKTEVKGIRISLRIGQHDIDIRKKRAIGFLKDGDKVKIEILLKGRERRNSGLGKEAILRFMESLNEVYPVKIDQPTTRQGAKFFLIVAPSEKVLDEKEETDSSQKATNDTAPVDAPSLAPAEKEKK